MTKLTTAYLSFVPMNSHAYPDAQALGLLTGAITNSSTIRAAMDFLKDSVYQLDFTSLMSTNPPHHGIQALYVDASAMNYGPMIITVQGNTLTQSLVVPALTQGYYPIVCQSAGPLQFSFENDNGTSHQLPNAASVLFLTIPAVANIWLANASATALATAPTQSITARAQLFTQGSNNALQPVLLADRILQNDYTNPPTSGTILTANSGQGYYVRNIQVSFDPTSAGGTNEFILSDSVSGAFWGTRFSFPSSRPNAAVPAVMTVATPPGFFYKALFSATSILYSFQTSLLGSMLLTLNWGVVGQ